MKSCSKCGKTFPDGVKLCPFDRIPLQSGSASPASSESTNKAVDKAVARTSSVADHSISGIGLEKDGADRILVPSRTFIHSIFGSGIIIGAVMLFMVFASITGAKAKGGSAAPEMSGTTAIIMSLLGIGFLGGGIAMRNFFKHYTVIDLKRRKLLRLNRVMGKVIEETLAGDLNNVKELAIRDRVSHVSADMVLDMITGVFKKDKATNQMLEGRDFSLVAVMRDGKDIEVTSYTPGEKSYQLADQRREYLDSLLFSKPG
ncbi:MAG: hypothetical protein ACOYXC_12355 [Candidatus Rifleibacteriota bacterium]